MSLGKQYISLKWGTLKGCNCADNDEAYKALERYLAEGSVAYGAMQQKDTLEQKQALCDLIDAIDGNITNAWTGDIMSKDVAKDYVMTYDN